MRDVMVGFAMLLAAGIALPCSARSVRVVTGIVKHQVIHGSTEAPIDCTIDVLIEEKVHKFRFDAEKDSLMTQYCALLTPGESVNVVEEFLESGRKTYCYGM